MLFAGSARALAPDTAINPLQYPKLKNTLQNEFSKAAKLVIHKEARASEGITAENGWNCFSGKDLKHHMSQLYTNLSNTQVGRSTIQSLADHDVDVCTASDTTFYKIFAGANYTPEYNTIFLDNTNSASVVTHEEKHAAQAIATDRLSERLSRDGKFTAEAISSLAKEAGAVARNAIHLFQTLPYVEGEGFGSFDTDNEELPLIKALRTIEKMVKDPSLKGTQQESLVEYFKNPQGEAPAFLVDALASELITNGNYAFWLKGSVSRNQLYYNDLSDKAQADFSGYQFDPKTVKALVVGSSYPNEASLIKTTKALNELSTKLAPFMNTAITTQQSGVALEQMTQTFITNLSQQQQYNTPQRTAKWQARPPAP